MKHPSDCNVIIYAGCRLLPLSPLIPPRPPARPHATHAGRIHVWGSFVADANHDNKRAYLFLPNHTVLRLLNWEAQHALLGLGADDSVHVKGHR